MRSRLSSADRPLPRGFTLVDVAITVLIIGLAAAAAVPRIGATLHVHRARSAAQRIQADLEQARRHAIASSSTVEVRFDVANDSYSIPALTSLDRAARQLNVSLRDYPYRARLLAADLGGDARIVFNLHGAADSGGSVTIAAGSRQTTVSVDAATGRAVIP